jgi:hypothetical protein
MRFTVDQVVGSVFQVSPYVCVVLTGVASGPSFAIDLGNGSSYVGTNCTSCPAAPTTTTSAPTTTSSPPPLTSYTGAGRGSSAGSACSDAGFNRTFYSDCGPFDFGVGCTVYVSAVTYEKLLGYEFVYINDSNWNIQSSTGIISGLASEQC